MKNLIITAAIVLGAATPSFAASAADVFAAELANSEQSEGRFVATQLDSKVDISVNTVATKGAADIEVFIAELERSDDDADRYLARQLAKKVSGISSFVQTGSNPVHVDELARGESNEERFLAKQLIKAGL